MNKLYIIVDEPITKEKEISFLKFIKTYFKLPSKKPLKFLHNQKKMKNSFNLYLDINSEK